ncbi:MAG: hybrid sensor histidine kinase/response regulator [Bacillales bacterium]|jgi:CheY-like chemotaxis protein|nr:hybrid sensor histidine kinase/response regulator [Bacillales bacterium]
MVVEDQINNMRLIEQILEDICPDIQLIKAFSGFEAILDAEKKNCNLVLMDISLPDMNGIQITEKLKEYPNFTNVPFIAVTAHALVEDELNFQTFFDDYISKPIDEDKLVEVINKWVVINE